MNLNGNIKKWMAMLSMLLCMLMGITAQAQVFIEGNVYGGGNAADVDATAHTNDATVVTVEQGAMGSVYGGGNEGSITGKTTVNINGGHIGYTLEKTESVPGTEGTLSYKERTHDNGLEKKWNGVYGGCYGAGTIVSGTTTVNIGSSNMKEDVKVYGSVYGGGEMGQVGGGVELERVFPTSTDFNSLIPSLYWQNPQGIPEKVENGATYDEKKIYYQLSTSSYQYSSIHNVNVKSDGTKNVHVMGSVYGGGRGYALCSIDGAMLIPLNELKGGAMYGSSSVVVGTQNQPEDKIQIDGTAYYFGQADMKQCYYANIDGIEKPVKWEKDIFVYDVDVNQFVKVNFEGSDVNLHNVMGVNNKAFLDYDIHSGYNPEVEYFERSGVVAVAGGGERGAIVGSTYGFDKDLLGGNTNVEIYSGTIGSVLADGNIEGEVYGGGLNAEVYGTTQVLVDGSTAWIRDAVFGGGCKGAVKNFKRINENKQSRSTLVNFKQGWARNVYGGNNMVEMGKGCRSEVFVGQGMLSDDVTLVSQSVYGGNAYSPHKGRTKVTIERGRVGFVKAGVDISKVGDAITKDYYATEEGIRVIAAANTGTIVPMYNDELIYDGSVYGGGFGPNASVKRTNVTMTGGIVKTGVFGGGEIAPVAYTTGNEGNDANAIVYTNRNMMSDGMVLETEVKHTKLAEGVNSTEVLISGGQASMVFGGGRGFSNYLGDTKSPEPGAVFGNVKVEISGNTTKIDTTYGYRAYAAGNVYGGGMEGIIYGSTDVSVTGGEIACNVYGGGRGFGRSYEELMAESQNISHRASMDAGALYKDSKVMMSSGKVGSSVYGGGEGWYAYTKLGGYANYDTTGTVRGIVKVDILGSSMIGGGPEGCYASLGDWDSRGVFGGGRMAAVWGYSDVSIYENAQVANVYGGNDISGRVIGKGRQSVNGLGGTSFPVAKDTTATYVKITGTPKIGRVFGGGNGNYIYYDRPEYAAMLATKPVQPSTYVDIKMDSTAKDKGVINAAFGGGNAANVDTSRVYVYGDENNVGLVDTVFGGGNAATVNTRAIVRMDMALTDINRINYLFGGNNKATMDIVPDICLLQGKVKNVYGGGNAGQMTASETRKDIFNQDVEDLSTYILVNSDQVVVSGALYGGCNHAKVHHGTFVDVRQTSGMAETTNQDKYGIANLYGGNDISDTVEWARLDVNNGLVHNMFGGGNGKYNYHPSGDYYYVTDFTVPNFDGTNHIASRTHGRPYTKTTYVNVYGGQIKSNVYGGGNAGDCANTNLVVNDTINHGNIADANLHISGRVFGGGNGILENLCKVDNVGNVKKLAKTDLYYVKTLENAYVYGGGNAGDVENTLLTVHPNWNQRLVALYGGCYGSNVWGTARTILNCDTIEGKDMFNIEKVYGGNDFSGVVKNSVLTVNSGKYYSIYGAGNGRYKYTDNAINPNKCTAPNSEMPKINFYDGKVYHNMYGGGDMGFVFKGDTTQTYTNVSDYSHIEVNVHGGTFYSNIFAGGAGSADKATAKQLVYGLKQLNMDGGYVRLSVYGGTENVRDGYANECVSKENTTKRPSSVLNITGGVIDNHVYGGGYLGTVYGSIFVNIGKEAVNKSPIWTNKYEGTTDESTYMAYKPIFVTDKKADTINHLMAQTCALNASVYNGANWGDAGENYIFNTSGFYGGESHILIDGEGYNTSISGAGSSLPFMHIENSLIGAGTSCEGGDVWRLITVRNYGVYYSENNNCGAAKKLQSIQRADRLLLENVAIELEGEQDAYTAYPSPSYTINRVDTVMSKGGNVVVFDNSATNMAKLQFLNADGTVCEGNTLTNMKGNLLDCTSGVTVCDKLGTVATRPYTTFFIKNGVSIDVVKSTETTDTYGDVEGFAYYIADEGTQATISARYKDETLNVNTEDGGFFSACYKENKFGLDGDGGVQFSDQTEFPYQNFSNIYRVWRIGNGKRTRQVTILAHSDVTQLPDDNKTMTVPYKYRDENGNEKSEQLDLALAKADLRLPPAGDGHYYKIEGGITVDEANGNEMNLLNTAWDPESWEHPEATTTAPGGEWQGILNVSADTDPREIKNNPTHVFGLLMESGHAFTDACPTFTNAPTCNQYITISGNNHYNQTNGYLSQKVSGDAEIIPKLRFYLTYSTNFASTILRDITFTLKEYDAANNFVGDIDVTVTVATIIDKFIDDDLEVLAMYNEGRTDKFVRKFVLPASLQRRDLYLKDIQWEPCIDNEMHAGATGTEENFGLLGSDKCTNKTELGNTAFGIELVPNEDITNAVASTLGWYSIVTPSINIYDEADKYNGELAYADKSSQSYSAKDGDNKVIPVNLKQLTNNGGKGTYVGVLDGRSTAAIDVVLHYNGETIYDKGAGYIGRVILGFEYYNAGTQQGTFNLTIYVKTREHGDTIYMAPDATLTRDGITIEATDFSKLRKDVTGKSPQEYVTSFDQAMANGVYQEGDVIAIMDKISIPTGKNIVIRGSDYSIIEVIRYSGAHYQFPGANCAYRGPLIEITGDGRFSAFNMVFNGSAVCKRKPWVDDIPSSGEVKERTLTDGTKKYVGTYTLYANDTMQSQAPIFVVKDNGTLTLSNKLYIQNNYNRYPYATNATTAVTSLDEHLFGSAINLVGDETNHPKVVFHHNVEINNNIISSAQTIDNHNSSGAIYVKDGIVELGMARNQSSIQIVNNYYDKKVDGAAMGKYWKDYKIGDKVARYAMDEDVLKGTTNANEETTPGLAKSNIYLTRTPLTTDTDNNMKDDISNVIQFKHEQSDVTRIGIRKWFPGPTERDTIQAVQYLEANPLMMERAFDRGLFLSDNDDYNIFYNSTINPYVIYLQRCASFKKQFYGTGEQGEPLYTVGLPTDNPIRMNPVIDFKANLAQSCSTGEDTLIFNVHGGFYPYTYKWERAENTDLSDFTVIQTTVSPYTNDQVNEDMYASTPNYDKAVESNSGIVLTKSAPMKATEKDKTYRYRATATDLMGCSLTKTVDVKVMKSEDLHVNVTENNGGTNVTTQVDVPGVYFYKQGTLSHKDTIDKEGTTSHTAKIERYFQGVHLEKRVVADGWGEVTGKMRYYDEDITISDAEFNNTLFCQGDRVEITATPTSNKKFIMWDFDPYDEPVTEFIIPKVKLTITAYFGPDDYWKDKISTETLAQVGTDYITHYNGDVDIYSEKGLAWLISVVNGLNGQQARPFFFNTVRIHPKSQANEYGNDLNTYDMKEHLWTPVGSFENKFRGRFVVEDGVVIKNIYLNEPQMEYVGFFGHLDSARVSKLNLQSVMAHGSQYVGGLAAEAVQSKILGCSVTDNDNKSAILSLITTNYTSGGLVAKGDQLEIGPYPVTGGEDVPSVAKAKFLGSAIYSGGALGYGNNVTIKSTSVRTDDRMTALYMGGIAGYTTGKSSVANAKAPIEGSYIANNYVHYTTFGNDQRVGGLVGFAKNTILENNYVYGEAQAQLVTGALGATLSSGVSINNCYYQEATAEQPFGINGSGSTPLNITTFNGGGNNVVMNDNVGGINNLTRVLNNWVREKNMIADSAAFLTWRSDLDTVNHGYPIFGTPDIIPVYDTITLDACDKYEWNDVEYTVSGHYSMNYVDSTLCIDSTITLNLIIHNSELSSFEDSVLVGESYNDYGFYLSATETELLRETVESEGVAVLQLTDTLQTEFGCDSVVVLNLTVYKNDDTGVQEPLNLEIKVYPNPTVSDINVEATGLISVEVYDNVSRKIAYREVDTDKCRITLSDCATGAYYLRIRTEQGVAIRKVIKK